MNPRFPLGKVTVKDDAARALALAGQDASFFLDKHPSGDYGEGDQAQNERGLREGSMVLSRYRTLRGHEILVFTSLGKAETFLFCPPPTINHVPLYDRAEWRKPGDKPLYGPDGQPNPELIWHSPPSGEAHAQEGMAMQQPGGNGSSKIPIHQDDMGGWVRVFTDKPGPLPEDFPVYLSATLAEWFRQRPQLLMQAVVPICRDGNTVELHAWYHVHVLPPRQGPQPTEQRQG